MTRRTLRHALAGALALPLLAAGPALGASVIIEEPSPTEGSQLQTTGAGIQIPVDWQLDATGCAPSTPTTPVQYASRVENLTKPGAAVLGFATSDVTPNGPATLVRSRQVNRDTDVRWTVTLTCSDALNPSSTISVSGGRTFRLLAPDLRARAQGRYLVTNSGSYVERGVKKKLKGRDLYTFRPTCKAGPCKAKVNIRGVGNITMRYAPRKKRWTGVLTGRKLNKVFGCRSAVTAKRLTGAYRGRVTITLTHVRGRQRVIGTRTRSMRMQGRLRGTLNLTAAGRNARCAKVLLRGNVRADAR